VSNVFTILLSKVIFFNLTELLQNINGIVIFKHGVKALFTEDELN